MGIAAFGAIFTSGLRHWLPLLLPGPIGHGITATGIQTSPGRIHTLSPAVQHGSAQAVASSLQGVFMVAAPIALVGFLIVAMLKEQPLRSRGGGESRAARPGEGAVPQERAAAA